MSIYEVLVAGGYEELAWWEEKGEKAPASWNPAKGASLCGFREKAKPRPKWLIQVADQGWTLKGVFRFFPFAWVGFQRASLFLLFPRPAFHYFVAYMIESEFK